jgi:magnesium transporter
MLKPILFCGEKVREISLDEFKKIEVFNLDKEVMWLDIEQITGEEAWLLDEKFGFHPLAIEDCVRGGQRPKLEEYPDYHFVVLQYPELTQEPDLKTVELYFFIGKNYVVSIHRDKTDILNSIPRKWEISPPELREENSYYLFYLIMDTIIDTYLPVLVRMEDSAEDLEDLMFQKGGRFTVEDVFRWHSICIKFRKLAVPHVEVVDRWRHRVISRKSNMLIPYYGDIFDHIARAASISESVKETLNSQLNLLELKESNRINMSVKVLTAITILLAVLTVITSAYGMNVKLPFAKFEWAFWLIVGISVAISGGLVVLFRYLKWL